MRLLDTILGNALDSFLAERLHVLEHDGLVEYLTIAPEDVTRRRFRLATDKGTECAIALDRNAQLSDGAVLHYDARCAIVVRLNQRRWLRLDAPDKAAALELGYFCGNLHWKVRFQDGLIHIALEGPLNAYLDRLALMLADGKVRVVDADA